MITPISRFLFIAELPILIEETSTLSPSTIIPLLCNLETSSSSLMTIAEASSPSVPFQTSLNKSTTSWSSSSRYAPLIIRCTPTPSMATSCRAVIIGFSSPQPYDQSTSRVCCDNSTSLLAERMNSVILVTQFSGQVNTSPETLA